MAKLIDRPTIIQSAGTPSKKIDEFVGQVNSNTDDISIARMRSPGGWQGPGQTPEFDEYSLVLQGALHVHLREGDLDVQSGQALIVHAGEWVQYSTPSPEGAEYIAVCLPAFSPGTVNRDEEERPV